MSLGRTFQDTDTVDPAWIDPWIMSEEATNALLESIEIPSSSAGLRGASNGNATENVFDEEDGENHGLSAEENSRRMQYRTDIKIINNCDSDALVFAIYFDHGVKRNARTPQGWPTIPKNGALTLKGATDPTFYLFGMTPSRRWMWVGSSDLCFDKGRRQCLRKVELGSLRGGTAEYKACGPKKPASGSVEDQWLEKHNSRRTQFYAQRDKGPLDLKWAPSLASSAQAYANKLIGASGCQIAHNYQGDSYGGENLAANWGSGRFAKSRTIEEVMRAWYDDEINLPSLGQKGHATQVVFRSSRYVGCASAEKNMEDRSGYKCFIQVCRYVAAGNCFENPSRWEDSVMSDTMATRCNGDQCLSLQEGCFTEYSR